MRCLDFKCQMCMLMVKFKFAIELLLMIMNDYDYFTGDQFKSSDVTLHDRFSKLQNAQSLPKDAKHLGPEIHRYCRKQQFYFSNKFVLFCKDIF